MKIAVTGNTGQVVSGLIERGAIAGHVVIPLGRPDLDLADPNTVLRVLQDASPDAIVSAAAYTAVDKAEAEVELAHAVNAEGAGAVARAAKALGVPLVHISTDYVFSGTLNRPYVETDPTGPTGVYGTSKLAGEQAVLDAHPTGTAVLRTAWVYSPFGGNFVKTMLRLAEDRDEVSVVADQVGNPTSALDIADGVLKVVSNLKADRDVALRGVFHMTAQGTASWADLATAIFSISTEKGGPSARVRRIATVDYPTPATRPANSRLDCSLIQRTHGITLPPWQSALETVIARLQSA
ncbi:dTDP-4-dehydrorhamnose reductase [Novosphingobium chloroacetimidivorans]|uniref:dTDP-4-dehydrorhamnose reductase n=1 Tax=Novosphingobium chloroacetimidivorans TaxID=1428314 RepID=A0A7W7KE92_9SPHN|nr:dTDP-4-dehydrorhamnose reductase [Novosphingobium chloroacetimidivorans]MBB4860593.1 dTDP-4-dehydrorhamnose reductase [Novosphingobium chloroacetimidivorans]